MQIYTTAGDYTDSIFERQLPMGIVDKCHNGQVTSDYGRLATLLTYQA